MWHLYDLAKEVARIVVGSTIVMPVWQPIWKFAYYLAGLIVL